MKAFTLGLTMCFAVSAFGQQPEPAIAVSESLEPQLIAYGEHTTGGSISPSTDSDRFVFDGVAGDIVRFIVDANSNGMDPRLLVLDPLGATFVNKTCTNGCSLWVDEVLPLSGSYTIIISESTANETGPYMLQLEKFAPNLNVQPLKYNSQIADAVSHRTDIDFFALTVKAGTILNVVLNATADGMDPGLEIYDSTMTLIASQSCTNGCTFTVQLSPAVDDVYLLAIHDTIYNESGQYSINAQCLFGACPAPAQPWTNLGNALPGTGMQKAILVGSGPLTAGSQVTLALTNALPGSTTNVVLGATTINAGFKGGVMVPFPDSIVFGLPVDGSGASTLVGNWPAGVPVGAKIYAQHWLMDGGGAGSQGFASSNAIEGEAQ